MKPINIVKMVLAGVGAVATIASQIIGDDKGKDKDDNKAESETK